MTDVSAANAEPLLVISAHAADFVWRAGGATALAASEGRRVVVVCLSYGERGESSRLWREGLDLDAIRRARHVEAQKAADVLGAELVAFDAGDYPLVETPALAQNLTELIRDLRPRAILTHTPSDPWNYDHATAHGIASRARITAQAPGFGGDPSDVLGAPPLLMFEPHQSEYCGFVPNVLLDITSVWDRKLAAMECMEGQHHLWQYYTETARRRGTQLERNFGPNLGYEVSVMGEAYQRVYPEVAFSTAALLHPAR